MKTFINFFKDLWLNRGTVKNSQNFFYKFLRVLVTSIRDFINDNGFDKASTLTFYSLLSIIPLIAIGFGIAQALGIAEKFSEQVQAQFSNQPQIAEKIIQFSNATLNTTRGGVIASFGLIVLVWTVFRTIGNIASSFDEIWKVKKLPTFWQQVKRYVPMIFLFPIFLVGSSSIIIYVFTQATLASESIVYLHFLGPFFHILIQLIPFFLNWGMFSFLYIYLPNTKVLWKAGIIAGMITTILYLFWQWIYVTFQLNAGSYGTIYGSFAAVPLFLIWLNYSWYIVLFGAELSTHIQKEIELKEHLENVKVDN